MKIFFFFLRVEIAVRKFWENLTFICSMYRSVFCQKIQKFLEKNAKVCEIAWYFLLKKLHGSRFYTYMSYQNRVKDVDKKRQELASVTDWWCWLWLQVRVCAWFDWTNCRKQKHTWEIFGLFYPGLASTKKILTNSK